MAEILPPYKQVICYVGGISIELPKYC